MTVSLVKQKHNMEITLKIPISHAIYICRRFVGEYAYNFKVLKGLFTIHLFLVLYTGTHVTDTNNLLGIYCIGFTLQTRKVRYAYFFRIYCLIFIIYRIYEGQGSLQGQIAVV